MYLHTSPARGDQRNWQMRRECDKASCILFFWNYRQNSLPVSGVQLDDSGFWNEKGTRRTASEANSIRIYLVFALQTRSFQDWISCVNRKRRTRVPPPFSPKNYRSTTFRRCCGAVEDNSSALMYSNHGKYFILISGHFRKLKNILYSNHQIRTQYLLCA